MSDITSSRPSLEGILRRLFVIAALALSWVGILLAVGTILGTSWFFLRKGFMVGFAAMLLLLGCANMIRPTMVTRDTVSLSYDTLGNNWDSVVVKAQKLCGSEVEVLGKWDNIGRRGATFKCVRSTAKTDAGEGKS